MSRRVRPTGRSEERPDPPGGRDRFRLRTSDGHPGCEYGRRRSPEVWESVANSTVLLSKPPSMRLSALHETGSLVGRSDFLGPTPVGCRRPAHLACRAWRMRGRHLTPHFRHRCLRKEVCVGMSLLWFTLSSVVSTRPISLPATTVVQILILEAPRFRV